MTNSKKDFNQPHFGILRPLGDFSGEINNTSISYEELWKHDEYIHLIPEIKDENDILAPIPPKKTLFMPKKVYEEKLENYTKELEKYEKEVEKIKTNNLLNEIHKLIKKKYNYTCHFCKFQDKKFIEIHHLDSNHFNNNPENLVPACTLCHRQHHLLWLSVCDDAEIGVANIDYLTQTELNHLQRIAIVMKDNPEYEGLLGKDGKLGSLLSQFTYNFSRPLHAFMVPETEKRKNRELHISTHKLEYPQTGNQANYNLIELALDNLDNPKPSKAEKDALDEYDALIAISDARKSDPNASDEDIRNKNSKSVREAMAKYDKNYQEDFEKKFNEDKETFSIFELAMALKSIDYKDYQQFNPKYMFLIFKDTIFTKEQIEYYKKLDYFNVDNWGFGDK